MSGHNKWSKIARKKGINDQKRGKIFSKIIREITVAAKIGGSDPASNFRLRNGLLLAKSSNMPKDVIDRAIKKGAGDSGNINFEEITYEGYGPNGVALMVKCLTDNKIRTVAEVRHIITKYGGNLGSSGSVNFLFDKKGVIEVNKTNTTEETIMDIAIENGADDVADGGDTFDILATPDNFETVRKAIEDSNIDTLTAEITMVPQNTITVSGDNSETMMKLIEGLEDIDDVQNVYSNVEFEE